MKQIAAVRIQRTVRAFLLRMRTQRRHAAAVRIQALYRGHVARTLKSRLVAVKQHAVRVKAAQTIQVLGYIWLCY